MQIFPIVDSRLISGTSAGQILFWTGSLWTPTETSELFWDDTNKRLGVGVADPDTIVEILKAGTQLKLSYDGTNFITFAVQSDGDIVLDSNKASYDFDLGDALVKTTGDIIADRLIVGTASVLIKSGGAGSIGFELPSGTNQPIIVSGLGNPSTAGIYFDDIFFPQMDNAYDIGTSSKKLRTIYSYGLAIDDASFKTLTLAADAGAEETDADDVLTVTGGKGGAANGTNIAGDGSDIILTAGEGGDGAGGDQGGDGGSITLTAGKGDIDAQAIGTGGNINLINPVDVAGIGGDINLTIGAAGGAVRGDINLTIGTAGGVTGGIINLKGEVEAGGLTTKIKLTSLGGYAIKLTNKTGGNTVAGQLVAPYSATAVDDAFKTAGANSDEVFGIVLDAGIADGSEAWIVVSGRADVLMDGGGSARGDRIISSATAGSADVWNTGGAVATHFLEIGHCIETRTGAGLARCVLHFN